MSYSVYYFLPGKPQGQNRPRAVARGGFARLYNDEKSNSTRMDHVSAFLSAHNGPVHEGPVSVEIRCTHQPAKDHWEGKTCKCKPDADNVSKVVLDALNGVAYKDDSQVHALTVSKQWAEQNGIPGVQVVLKFHPVVTKPKKGRK